MSFELFKQAFKAVDDTVSEGLGVPTEEYVEFIQTLGVRDMRSIIEPFLTDSTEEEREIARKKYQELKNNS